jgi:protein-disulfide isomerase
VLVLFGVLDVRARRSAARRFVAEYEGLVPVEIPQRGSVAFGPEEAPVTVVEYTEYGCRACREVRSTVKELLRRYPEQVRVVVKDYPISYDCRERGDPRELPVPCIVPLVARYAHEEGKWWETSEALFRRYERLKTWEDVLAITAQAGLDTTQLVGAVVEGDLLAELRSDIEEVHSLGIDEVPTFVINGRILPVVPSSYMFDAIVEYETAEALTGRHEHRHRSTP